MVMMFFAFCFQGNIKLFTRFTEWEGPHVLYFGDHVYSDLMVDVIYVF